ncbi:MAG: hypothetical protein A2284_14920 [Deltaproteobacteria bacterium RIFOXYA12_FULL_61_11]|nr:MAG: hypothetical protein A2284_14920 [Deltaproteobacteria bacterium RIFOXYA12_FULL_61_11]
MCRNTPRTFLSLPLVVVTCSAVFFALGCDQLRDALSGGGFIADEVCAKLDRCADEYQHEHEAEEDYDDIHWEDCTKDLSRANELMKPEVSDTFGSCILDSSCQELGRMAHVTCLMKVVGMGGSGGRSTLLKHYCKRKEECDDASYTTEECERSSAGQLGNASMLLGMFKTSAADCFHACLRKADCRKLDEFYALCGTHCRFFGLDEDDSEELCNDHGRYADGKCACEEGYLGDWCDECPPGQHLDDRYCYEDCTEATCGGHGTCYFDHGPPRCACLQGYEGYRCESCSTGLSEVDGACIDVCAEVDCHHGHCTVQQLGTHQHTAHCICDRGYFGETCEVCWDDHYLELGECLPHCKEDSCSGHGTCEGYSGAPVCTCEEGYAGETCSACAVAYERDVSGDCVGVCEPDSCSGRGTCDGSSGEPVCTCEEGYGGPVCGACAGAFVEREGICILPVQSVAFGGYHVCAVFVDGRARCWGSDAKMLGYGAEVTTSSTDELAFLGEDNPIAQISAGTFHTCFRYRDDQVKCVGLPDEGRLGSKAREYLGIREPLAQVPAVRHGGNGLVALASGSAFTCVQTDNGELRCWGINHFKWLLPVAGDAIGDDEYPEDVGPIPLCGPVSQFELYDRHGCAVLEDDTLQCWGISTGWFPTVLPGACTWPRLDFGEPLAEVVVGGSHACARFDDGSVTCWGDGSQGQLGYGDTVSIGHQHDLAPLPAEGAPRVDLGNAAVQLSAGGSHTCALLEGGEVLCWGANESAQLGCGHTDRIGDNEVPADSCLVPLPGKALRVAAWGGHTCAVLEEGDLYCWGEHPSTNLWYGDAIYNQDVPLVFEPGELRRVELFR